MCLPILGRYALQGYDSNKQLGNKPHGNKQRKSGIIWLASCAAKKNCEREANKSKKKFCSCGLLNSELGGFSCNACYEYLKIRFRDEDFDQV